MRSKSLLALVLVAIPSLAWADGGSSNAESAFREGVLLFQQKKYAEAATDFERAYSASPTEKYLWNLALSEFRADRYWAAYRHFRQYKADPQGTAENLARIDGVLSHISEHIGHLSIDAPSGFSVAVDGEVVGVAPLQSAVDVDPDREHDVRGDQAAKHLALHVPSTGPRTVAVLLAEAPPASAQFSLPPAASMPEVVSASPLPSSHESRVARNVTVITIAGLAVVSAGVGVGYLGVIQNDKSDRQAALGRLANQAANLNVPSASVCYYHPQLADCGAINNLIQRQNNDVTIQRVLYVGAGGLGVAALVTFLVWPTSHAKTSAWVLPRFDRDGASFAVGGSF